MKLKSFRIRNYKSIIDTGECRLSDNDNITALAGQNESGKSSILQALRDYEDESLDIEALREDESWPVVSCTYDLNKEDMKESGISDMKLPERVMKAMMRWTELKISKTFSSPEECGVTLGEEGSRELSGIMEEENDKIKAENEKNASDSNFVILVEWEISKKIEEVATKLFKYTPKIIFFDDFCDLLPDRMLLSDIKSKNENANGYQAVKNIESILQADFNKLDGLSDNRRENIQSAYHETITAQFNEKWKQRISDGDGAKVHVKYYRDDTGKPYLNFYIETKKGEYLSASKRSQGFKWFLSFFLQLKAEDKGNVDLVILFDEPGLYLHSKAQLDMISVFEELGLNDNQIIYSTHSPYLIDTRKLHRVRLVFNTRETGTVINKITSKLSTNQLDAMKPIVDALGLEVASPFSVAKKNNVIVEGISDFHYLQAMKIILARSYDIGILPSMGSPNCHLLMELCIGWGLNWVIIFDDKGAAKDYNKIKKNFFSDDDKETQKYIYRLAGCDGIEDMFTIGDLKLVEAKADFSTEKKNSEVVKEYGGKELYARLFYEKVLNGQIKKEKLSQTCIKNFEDVFAFIENTFS